MQAVIISLLAYSLIVPKLPGTWFINQDIHQQKCNGIEEASDAFDSGEAYEIHDQICLVHWLTKFTL